MSEQVTDQVAPDLYSLDLTELRRLANEEGSNQQETVVVPRDEQGRFTKVQDDVDDDATQDEEVEEVPPVVAKKHRRVIDIGDGVDPEVFEADSLEALLDKVTDAKKHATKKIREQEAQLKKAKADEPRKFSEDEEWVYSQEMLKSPTTAVMKIIKDATGVDIGQFKTLAERVKAMDSAQQVQKASHDFITTHSDYEDNTRNGTLMQKWMGDDKSPESFEKAYQELKTRGLLELKDGEASSVQGQSEQTQKAIPSDAVKTPPQGTKSSSIQGKNRVVVAPKKTEPTEDDFRKMSMDELRKYNLTHPGR